MDFSTIILWFAGLALVVLAIFLCAAAAAAVKTLRKLDQTLNSLQKQIDALDKAPRQLLDNVNEISANLQQKMVCLDPLFRSIANLSAGLESSSSRYKEALLLECLQKKLRNNESASKIDNVAEGIELALQGIALWKKLKQ
jgi:uncharacterized protein YoxC